MFGLTPAEYEHIRSSVVLPLQALGAQVYCYGSRARGDHRQYSDLDLMVEADRDLAATVSEIQEQLSRSNFPYKVDLVQLRHFAEAYKAGYLTDRKLF